MSKKPDYTVAAMNKATDAKSNIGAAWINSDGTVSIILDAFVVLHGGKELLVTLFPRIKE